MFTTFLKPGLRWLSRCASFLSMLGRKRLYVAICPDGAVKIGTCKHCVVSEPKRPARAWEADGDTALDFERDVLLTTLASYGIEVTIDQEYVCP